MPVTETRKQSLLKALNQHNTEMFQEQLRLCESEIPKEAVAELMRSHIRPETKSNFLDLAIEIGNPNIVQDILEVSNLM